MERLEDDEKGVSTVYAPPSGTACDLARPEYLAATDRLPDAIRVADKMLSGARAAN